MKWKMKIIIIKIMKWKMKIIIIKIIMKMMNENNNYPICSARMLSIWINIPVISNF